MIDAGVLPLDETTIDLLQWHDQVRVPVTKDAAAEHKHRIEEGAKITLVLHQLHDQVPDDKGMFCCIHFYVVLHLPIRLLTNAYVRLFLRPPDDNSESAPTRMFS